MRWTNWKTDIISFILIIVLIYTLITGKAQWDSVPTLLNALAAIGFKFAADAKKTE